jgi:hypothetical protein
MNFRTIPVINTQLTLYSLAIRDSGFGLTSGYTFPISPANIRKETTALTNFYDVMGPPELLGVQRIIDVYGTTPVMYTIEGTTGWKLHNTDGFALTGLDSIRAIESLLEQFAFLNQSIIADQQGQDLFTLEFYDYFRNDYWQVVPYGQQMIRQSRNRPLFVDYLFRLIGVQDLSSALFLSDTLVTLLTQVIGSFVSSILNFGNTLSNNYG